jgi:hypothetical protein
MALRSSVTLLANAVKQAGAARYLTLPGMTRK